MIEEFGKAIPASYIYDSHLLLPGEWVQDGLSIRDQFFKAVYAAVEDSALKGAGPIGGSNFWCVSLSPSPFPLFLVFLEIFLSCPPRRVYYRNDGQGSSDPYRVTSNDKTTMQLIADHAWNMRAARSWSCPAGANSSAIADDGRFLDTAAVKMAPTSAASSPPDSSDLLAVEADGLAATLADSLSRAYSLRAGPGALFPQTGQAPVEISSRAS